MDNELYSIKELKAAWNDANSCYRLYGTVVVDDDLHAGIIMDTLSDAIDRLKAKSRKKRNKKNRGKTSLMKNKK